jgi:hypothetical protein
MYGTRSHVSDVKVDCTGMKVSLPLAALESSALGSFSDNRALFPRKGRVAAFPLVDATSLVLRTAVVEAPASGSEVEVHGGGGSKISLRRDRKCCLDLNTPVLR